MKADIHPEYVTATVRCACGNSFETRATKPDLHIEVCSACHPFFTGEQRIVDTAGRVERFRRRYGLKESRHTYARGPLTVPPLLAIVSGRWPVIPLPCQPR